MGKSEAEQLMDDLIRIQVSNLGALTDLSTRLIVEKAGQDATDLKFDAVTGELLGALSAAALAAKAALERKLILKGGGPGNGL